MAGLRPAADDAGTVPASTDTGSVLPSHDAGSMPASRGADDKSGFPADAVEVGRVIGAWGVKGAIKVKPFSSDPQALFCTKRWYLQRPETAAAPGPKKPASGRAEPVWPLLLHITRAREQGDHVVASADELEDRDAAQALAGARLFVSRSSFPTPAPDEFYWVDLIDLAVHNREGLALGTVAGLLETGPVCVLRVRPERTAGGPPAGGIGSDNGRTGGSDRPAEILIPFVSAYIDRVDLPARCIHVDWQPDY